MYIIIIHTMQLLWRTQTHFIHFQELKKKKAGALV